MLDFTVLGVSGNQISDLAFGLLAETPKVSPFIKEGADLVIGGDLRPEARAAFASAGIIFPDAAPLNIWTKVKGKFLLDYDPVTTVAMIVAAIRVGKLAKDQGVSVIVPKSSLKEDGWGEVLVDGIATALGAKHKVSAVPFE